jgi:hypothetical protein
LAVQSGTHIIGGLVAKPNFRFQKQQRELKKAKQQEEKRRKKLARGETKAEPAPQEENR